MVQKVLLTGGMISECFANIQVESQWELECFPRVGGVEMCLAEV